MKTKPHPGHKFGRYSYGVQVNCECGWESAISFGKGARSNAAGEWHMHIDKCKASQSKESST